MALPLGLACWMSAIKDRGWGYHIGVIVCTIWLAIENPYLATILPLAEVVAFLWHKEKRSWWFWTGIVSGMGILTVAHAYGAAANPNYPREVAGQYVLLMNKSEYCRSPVGTFETIRTDSPDECRLDNVYTQCHLR